MIERPTLNIDLSVPLADRYSVLPADAVRTGKSLLRQIKAQVPPGVLDMVDDVGRATGYRFRNAAIVLGAIHGVDWPDVMVANVVYDLFIAMGCSTVALP